MGRRDVDEAVRARARARLILAARPEVARGRDAFERGKGDGQINGAPDGRAPCWSGRPGVRGGGEHVFAKVGAGADGSGGLHAILHGPLRALTPTPSRPATLGAYTVAPSDDQTSIFVRTRATTSLVKPLVVASPPRSGVRTPAAVASRTDS